MGARGQFNTRFGFIMAAVGSAVGLGNLVRFPREMAGQGGAAFLLVYLVLLLLVGLPAILAEMSVGKMAQKSPLLALKELAGKHGKRWQVLGMFGVLAALFVLFFYTVLTGWALRFFLESFRDGWWGSGATTLFADVAFGPWAIFWHLVVVAVTIYIISRGVSGIEKVVVVIMPALFLVIVGIVVFAGIKDIQSGAEGLKTVFRPDFSEMRFNHISNATGQVFFSLSLGQGAMLTYASYMDKKQSVAKDGTTIAFADTGVAVLAAMMVFPILAFTGLLTSTDPAIMEAVGGTFGTAFIALPVAFNEMGAVIGRIVGTVFFLGLFFAALSSAISLLEVPVSVAVDNLGWVRWKATVAIGLLVYCFGVIAAINETWFNLFDQIAVNFFVVIGVALLTFFAGWIAKGVAKELDTGLKSRIGVYLVWMMRTVAPVLIIVTFLLGGLWGAEADGSFNFWYQAPADCETCTTANFRGLVNLIRDAFTGN